MNEPGAELKASDEHAAAQRRPQAVMPVHILLHARAVPCARRDGWTAPGRGQRRRMLERAGSVSPWLGSLTAGQLRPAPALRPTPHLGAVTSSWMSRRATKSEEKASPPVSAFRIRTCST